MTQRNHFIDDAGLFASSSLTHLLQGHNNGTVVTVFIAHLSRVTQPAEIDRLTAL